MEHLTMQVIVEKLMQEWVKAKKQFVWVENQFKKVPSIREIEAYAKQFKIRMPKTPRIDLVEKFWRLKPEILKQYWESAGGTIS